MSFSGASFLKNPSALEQLLEEINFQRTKEMRQLLKDDSGFVVLQGSSYWTDLFVRHFLFQAEHCIDADDLLFFVRKKHIKGTSRYLPKFETEVDVYRKDSRKLPIGDPDMDWEETVFLNLIIHQFDYTLTLAICTRTSPKQLQVLRRHSQKVYASPSRRRMDTKGEVEEMTYPYVCFMVDNFNEVFSDIMVRDGEMVCVELVASDRSGDIQSVIFLGSIRYDALKRVYDARASMSSKVAHRMTFGLFSNSSTQRVEFVRMKGPQGKGHAEMAVTKPKGCGAETPTSEPGYCATDMWDSDWDEDPEEFFIYRHQRRLSDPSANLNNFVRGGWRTKADMTGMSNRARSENEGLDHMADGMAEVEAGDVRDDCTRVHLASSSSSTTCCTTSRCVCHDHCMGMKPQEQVADASDSDEDEFHDCLSTSSWEGTDLEVGVDVTASSVQVAADSPPKPKYKYSTNSLPKNIKDFKNQRMQWLNKQYVAPAQKMASDGTTITYWCDVGGRKAFARRSLTELDDGAYNPLWTMRGFTQTFHFWKENKRAQSVPLNAFLTYVTLPWGSIIKDILDHREEPILTF
ncbi:uncharacterized protein LOC111048108 isoform X1 [Nilaparvata lugens]|uniref:uncharacterized protein LOC111048108 isoform X1 n=1 Tax=Nilaparvata lugens TaxID=108931 RepID=UPI00193E9D3E|nr:uncharacterized protein LOC111048108 isoform X1 [Nilaparvata lugens]